MIVLLLGAVGAMEAQAFTVGDLNYSVNSGTQTVTVTGHVDGTSATGELLIPDSVLYQGNYYSVTTIGFSAFQNCTGFTGSLTIPNSVTTIEVYAFRYCSGFTGSLTIPNSVTSIGYSAFEDCTGFTGSLTLGDAVTTIGDHAFCDCTGFTGGLTLGDAVTTIGHSAFSGCSGFTGDLTIPNSVTTIDYYVFYNCSGFTGSLTIGNSVTTIEQGAFAYCSGLTGDLVIPNSVTTIGCDAFCGCTGFTGSLVIPNSMTEIGNWAFYNCSGFTGSLTLGDALTTIGGGAFYHCSSLTGDLVIPNSVTTIGYEAFCGCTGFTGSLTLGDAVTTIGEYAFQNCSGFNSMVCYAETPPNLENNPFYGWSNSTPIYVPCGSGMAYSTMSWGGFSNFIGVCSGIITVAASPEEGGIVSGGGEYVFGETCTVSATANEGFTFMYWTENNEVVSYDPICSFFVPYHRDLVAHFALPFTITTSAYPEGGGIVSDGGTFDYGDTCTVTATANEGYYFASWQNGATVFTDSEYTFRVTGDADLIARFVTDGNIVFHDSNVKAICIAHWDTNGDNELSYLEASQVTDLGNYFQGNTAITSFNELQYFWGLSSIGANAFKNCTGLTSVTLPPTVTTIGNSAFYGCTGFFGLLNLPNGIITIGDYAYYNCNGFIGSLTIPNTVTTIGSHAFENCSGFMGLLTIGESVTTIGNYAFSGCVNLTGNINIPNSVVTIGNNAFYGCTAFWGTLTIGNSVTSIGNYAFAGCTGLVGNLVIPNSVTTIGSYAFYDCHSFAGTLTIGNSVITIGNNAFQYCYSLVGDIVVPNTVTTIGNAAFYGCTGFAGTLTIGNSVTTIGNESFHNCSSLVGNIDIPSSVTSVGQGAFANCSGFTGDLMIPSSVTTIGNSAFYYCTGLSQVYYNVTNHADITYTYSYYPSTPPFYHCGGHLNIGNNVVRIPAYMFMNASFTGTLSIPNSVIAIADGGFYGCSGFTGTLVLPEPLSNIGISAFEGCTGLSEVIMGNNVLVVGNTSFKSCSGLIRVTLPYPVIVIGIEAFRDCTNLIEVNIQSMQAPSIGWDVFLNNASGRLINIPCGAMPNYTAGYWSEWSDVLHEVCDGLMVTAEVDPESTGSVSGTGTYNYSDMCTLIATPNTGYHFVNWTKNGVVVSTDASYTFGVTESCTLVAHFALNVYLLGVGANPEEGGTVNTSGGTWLYGDPVTFIATPNEDWHFVNWTKNGEVVCTDSIYSFIVTEAATYLANFEQDSYEITATANPEEGGTVSGTGTYNKGQYCILTAIANEGYSFVNWTKDGVVVASTAIYSFPVYADGAYVANFEQSFITQSTHFDSGWTWWSTYIEEDEDSCLTQLETGLGASGQVIKSQSASHTHVGNGWFGGFTSLDNALTYRVKTNAEVDVDITGQAANTASHPVTLQPNWTWIGYPCTMTMSVGTALAGITPEAGDLLKSQTSSAMYLGSSWVGALNTLTPGMGLMYYSKKTTDMTLVYPTGAKGEDLKPNLTAENNHWQPNTAAYPDNMTVIAVVELDDEESALRQAQGPQIQEPDANYELAVFANGECRGSVQLLYIELLNRYMAIMTVAGDTETELRFGLYDMTTGEEYHNANETLTYQTNAIVGSPDAPFVVRFRSNTGLDDFSSRIQVFPNPVERGQTVRLGMADGEIGEVQVDVINALGVLVETRRATSLQAPDVAGVYTLRITVEGQGMCYRKLIVR